MKNNEEKTKICKYCKSEIPADAKICPHCRKKQSGGKGKWIFVAIVFIVIIAAVAGGGNNKPEKVEKTSSETLSGNSNAETVQETNVDDTFTVGDTAEFDGIQITLASAILSNGDGEFVKPDEGKYFLGLIFDIDNQSSKDINISSIASFEAYCDDYSLNTDLIGYQAPEFNGLGQLDGSVAAGKKMNGVICYQVPEDFTNFEISCTPDFWGSNKVTFQIDRSTVDSSAIN